jgi:1-aminocyclopropane-1-carboxylate deaminase
MQQTSRESGAGGRHPADTCQPQADPSDEVLLTRLDDAPVCGVVLNGVSLLRLDLQHGLAPGNKMFKLKENLLEARRRGVRRLVSFGGPWSNHLHALAAIGREQGFETVGIVRGEAGPGDTAMLADVAAWGMHLVNMSRADYRERNDPACLRQLEHRFGPCLVIPEGGANTAGVRGCLAIAKLLREVAPSSCRVVLPVGTGTTLAGLAAGLPADVEVVGMAALKRARDLEVRVARGLASIGADNPAPWTIRHDSHCGGFARVPGELREFILAFEKVHGVPLDPVYTGKALYAIHRLRRSGEWGANEPLVMIHTGGLQGRRGFPFLTPL